YEYEPEHEPEHAFDAWKAPAHAHCERCAQLADTLQVVILDNDVYRKSNERIRQKAEEAVNQHNKLVPLVLGERDRHIKARAAAKAKAQESASR
ncbi:hypothetical protein EV175_001440, partial [Coemansia sp. RSA 1933]